MSLTVSVSPKFERERTWRRISSGFQEGISPRCNMLQTLDTEASAGLCVLTVGTGEHLSAREVDHMSLIPAHCYAVVGEFFMIVFRRLAQEV